MVLIGKVLSILDVVKHMQFHSKHIERRDIVLYSDNVYIIREYNR